jgi:exopolysaccharide biosynthesis protein
MRITAPRHRSFARWFRLVIFLLLLLMLIVLAPSASLLPSAFADSLTLTAEKPLPIDSSPGYTPDPDAYLPDGAGYLDASISVQVTMDRAYDTNIMLVNIQIADPSQLRTAMSSYYGSTATDFGYTMAKHNNAVLAINGDFYSIHSSGYLVRQGKLYRNLPDGDTDILAIDENGDFHIFLKATRETLSAFTGTVINSFSFGPALVVDGVRATDLSKEEAAPQKLAQRICIAQTGPLSYLCVATEGPENEGSLGLTLEQFADYVAATGCTNAYNLDGGSSSTVVLNNKKINSLTTQKMRQLSDIIYFATATPSK